MKKLVGLVLLMIAGYSSASFAPGQYTMSSIHSTEFQKLIQDVHQQYGSQMLLVFDDDNTLETTDKLHHGYLGGVAWFDWQAGLLKSNSKSAFLVADSFSELLKVQWYLFQHIPMVETESGLAQEIQRMQAIGVPVMIETARGPVMSQVTDQALQAGHFHMNYGLDQAWAPFIPNQKNCGIARQKRWVSFAHGVYYTSGQNKGLLLDCLFNRENHQPRAIVFVDDTVKNDSSVWQYFKQVYPSIAIYTVHDTHLDQMMADFTEQQKQQANALWQKMKPGYEQWRNAFTPSRKSV